jgi:hypothetical protein
MRVQVQISLSQAEKQSMDDLAKAQGLSRSALTRKMLLNEAYEAGRRDILQTLKTLTDNAKQ